MAVTEANKIFRANRELCTGCRICEFYCPDFAIAIAEEEGASAGPAAMEETVVC